jgi:ribosomal protein S18 acetylase RimI-like enzyme
VPVELHSASTLTPAQLAALFTAAYEGYAIPFTVDEPTFAFMVDAFDLDVDQSLVAVEDENAVGLANLGRRGHRTWLGGVGVVQSKRREGIGELLTRSLLDRAAALGATEMTLEVIVENEPAIRLYEKLGFVRTRELDVLALERDDSGGAADEVQLEVAQQIVRAHRESEEPWQRSDETLAYLASRAPAPRGLAAGDAAAIYRPGGESVGLVQAAGEGPALHAVISTLRAKGTVSAVNYPSDGPVAAALRAAGARVTLRQYEMVKRLA